MRFILKVSLYFSYHKIIEKHFSIKMNNNLKYTELIKSYANKLGFDSVGFAKAEFLESEAERLETWLNNNYHGKMYYMANHFDKRLDPRLLLDNCKTVVVFTYNYFPNKIQLDNSYKVSKYAYGADYHTIVKDKLYLIYERIQETIGDINARVFVDSAPILERIWAAKSGLGWQGKHTLLINKKRGSYFFIGIMLLDIELTYNETIATNHCGTCTKCIDACPTDAILHNNILDASKCISYLTIELKDEIIPSEFKNKMENYIFGCDICQDVCPWNRFSKPHQENAFELNSTWFNFSKNDWQTLTEDTFKLLFKHSPIKRSKFKGFKRNIDFLNKF